LAEFKRGEIELLKFFAN